MTPPNETNGQQGESVGNDGQPTASPPELDYDQHVPVRYCKVARSTAEYELVNTIETIGDFDFSV